ncbi:MAG: hypothetical protein IPH62_10765 [Ignavibacteriae bacterium]|nr:hypothetical protein [Ignavibacteriota bacterium]
MISSVSNSNSAQFYPQMKVNNSLTDEQKSTLKEIISNYDSSNMTENNWKSMMEEIKSSEIGPGEDMKVIMEEAGFEKPKGMKPPDGFGNRPPVEDKETIDLIKEYMEKKESGEISQDEFDTFLQSLFSSKDTTNGLLIDKSI